LNRLQVTTGDGELPRTSFSRLEYSMKYALTAALAAATPKALSAEPNPPQEQSPAVAKRMGSPSKDGQ